MKQILLVFVGGGVGSALRYGVGKIFKTVGTGFPWGTFSVNIVGSLLIGLFMGIALKNSSLSENQTLLLITGFCGGFTTFSAFAYENQVFLKNISHMIMSISQEQHISPDLYYGCFLPSFF